MRTRSKLKNAELDMTPMIDVVFLLIVFFTLVINFAAADLNERVKLPISELAQPPEKPPTEPITLHILNDGKVIYNGREHTLPELKKSIDYQLLFLKHLRIPIENVTVIIRGDAQCKNGTVLDVLELCQEFNLTRFVLRTVREQPTVSAKE